MRPLILSQFDYGGRIRGIPVAEALLHEAVLSLGDELITRDHGPGSLLLAHELPLSHSRPDVVGAVVDLATWRRRKRQGVAACTAPQALKVAMALQRLDRPSTIDDVAAAMTGLGRPQIRKAIAELDGRNWIRRSKAGVRLAAATRRAVTSLVAVEAKVDNWRRAVRQAQGTEVYVDDVWLAFPQTYLRNVPRGRRGLRRFGLIAVDDRTPRIVRKPSGRKATPLARALTEEHLYAGWLRATSSAT